MSDEETPLRVHPLRHASIFIYSPLATMDSFLILFTTTLLAEKLGAGILVGPIVPAYTLATFLTGPFWGWMADKFGRRHPLIVSGVFTVVGLLGFVLATEPWHLLVASAVRGIGGSPGIMISRVLVADLAPRKALGERMAGLSLFRYQATLIGFAMAGPLYEIYDRLPFIVAFITELVALLIACFVIPETLVKRSTPTEVMETEEKKLSRIDQFGQGAKEWFGILRRRGATLYIFSMLVSSVVGATAAIGSSLIWDHLTPAQYTIAFLPSMVIPLLGVILGGVYSDRVGRKWPVLFGGFVGALTPLFYTLVPGMAAVGIALPALILINSVSSIASVVGVPAFIAYFYEWVPNRERGRASATSDFLGGLVSTVGTLVGFSLTAFFALFALEASLYFAAIAGILVYILIWVAWKEAPLPEEKWKMRRSTIVLIIANILLFVITIMWWLFPTLISS